MTKKEKAEKIEAISCRALVDIRELSKLELSNDAKFITTLSINVKLATEIRLILEDPTFETGGVVFNVDVKPFDASLMAKKIQESLTK